MKIRSLVSKIDKTFIKMITLKVYLLCYYSRLRLLYMYLSHDYMTYGQPWMTIDYMYYSNTDKNTPTRTAEVHNTNIQTSKYS